MSRRLQDVFESQIRKRQKENDELTKWYNQSKYYKTWDQSNNFFQTWTSSECVDHSMTQYRAQQATETKQKSLEERRSKLTQLFMDDDRQWAVEVQDVPRKLPKKPDRIDIPTNVLKEINSDIKLAEREKKRCEAELKLYQQWKNENPIIRNYEMSQNNTGLKLAWLDQQIEKRMQEEKSEEEMKKLIKERDQKVQEEEELDKIENEEKAKMEKDLIHGLQLQMQAFRFKEQEAEVLKQEELKVIMKKNEIEDIIEKNAKELELKRCRDVELFNISQSNLKLRKKAKMVEEELRKQKQIIEEIIASKTAEEIENEEKRQNARESIFSYLNYIREQQKQEEKKQKFISFVFDSEAKSIWKKQEQQWLIEQQSREKLLNDVLQVLKEQIDEKLTKNLGKQKNLLKDREEMFQKIEDNDKQMQILIKEAEQKKIERKLELDDQVTDKRIVEYEQKLNDHKKKREELERIQREENKLSHELIKMQSKSNQPSRHKHKRRIIW